MNQLELLSPAGDLQIFKAVVDAGADAVYFGGDLFGARAYAKNFTIDEAAEAIKYAHLHGRKAYLTVNTLLKNLEIEERLYPYLKAYVENGIDAFIVQDFGVFNFIREYFPDTHVHVSTQCSLCTGHGAKFFEDLGAKRIVTARELSIAEIAAIHKQCPELEIESFIHGALCVCYSGQCLMSSILGGRSGNRGRCAQPCRLPYEAFDEGGKKLKKKGNYILSPKDFCTINHLPEMIEAGVMSFKIEGRMKQLSYATGVVSVYRKYIDEYLYKGAKNYSVSEEDIQKLLDFGNRSGFTDLYLNKHNGPEMITFEAPSHTKTEVSATPAVNASKIKVDCRVRAVLGEEFQVTFTDGNEHKGFASGNIIEAASKKPTTKEDIEKAVSGLGNTIFEMGRLIIDCDEDIFLPVSVIKNARRDAIEALTKELSGSNEAPTINDFKPYKFVGNNQTQASSFVTISTKEQLEAVVAVGGIDRLAVPFNLFDEAINAFDGEVYIYLPTVLREDCLAKLKIDDRAAGVIAASFDELGWLHDLGYDSEKIIVDHRLYTFNNRSVNSFRKLDYGMDCIPYELSLKELKHRDNARSQMIVYSRIPMMVTANCTVKNTVGCKKNNDRITIVDRKNENLVVQCNCDYCYNTIYNSKKYIAFDMKNELLGLGIKEFRLDFTVEDFKETKNILKLYKDSFIEGNNFRYNEDYTKGHLRRGVE
ncbi:putative protease [Pseudobutyrivibrio sp. YE44]|uniref:peptidase U32 family protein n=1 Tax=Pseudobutyrivibrio sp. YE44 TaxID=1520802 RepID=UPI00088F1FA9|nr:U32 family peptidase [Pseudobutyrivibrio sp. YE44]SDB09128.1 putative protease [Pseudobutyrivibrio sp. YE44]